MERRGHPLPHPSSTLTAIAMAYDDRMISSSESCFSSSWSFDDMPEYGFNRNHRYSEFTNLTMGRSLKSNSQRQQHVAENKYFASGVVFPDISTSPRNEFHCLYGETTPPNGNGLCTLRTSPEIKFKPKSRSPTSSPLPTGQTIPTSPFHPQTHCFGTESSTEKQEDGKNQGHPLPLPPSSINSSTSHTSWNTGVNDNVQCLDSRWKKGKLLGRGTFGHVFAGFNSDNGQMCAIKEVKVISDDQNSKECLRQLNHEIDLLSQLSHPNIVRYYGSELNEDTLSVYLEYVSGGSIHKLLQEYGPFPEPVIQSYTRQILSGLAYLHRRNTVHRDIKGANILVDPNGEIKLGDFGMAKHVTSSSVLSCKGSPYWMAPEVIMNNSNGYKVAVDIWSLGCTILEMATSKPPWSQYEGVAAMFKIGNSKDIPQIPDHFSADGKKFLKLCLQHDPSLRPTAAKLLEHPFVHDQAMEKIANININVDTFQSKHDITHLLNKIAVLSNQMNALQYDGDYDIRHISGFSKHCNISSDQVHARTNSSLPVSPCSSPLQRSGSTRQSSLSSTHPAYTMRMGGYAMIGHAFFPSQTNANLMEKQIENNPYPRPDISQLKVQSRTGSPRVKRKPSW